ncbi:MAG: hypothetical protein EOO41_03905, partial [Methanobacteriota archaeon]
MKSVHVSAKVPSPLTTTTGMQAARTTAAAAAAAACGIATNSAASDGADADVDTDHSAAAAHASAAPRSGAADTTTAAAAGVDSGTEADAEDAGHVELPPPPPPLLSPSAAAISHVLRAAQRLVGRAPPVGQPVPLTDEEEVAEVTPAASEAVTDATAVVPGEVHEKGTTVAIAGRKLRPAPLVPCTNVLEEAGASSTASATNGGPGIHVLVIDDETTNCKLVCRMLRRLGCTTDVLYDGADLPTYRKTQWSMRSSESGFGSNVGSGIRAMGDAIAAAARVVGSDERASSGLAPPRSIASSAQHAQLRAVRAAAAASEGGHDFVSPTPTDVTMPTSAGRWGSSSRSVSDVDATQERVTSGAVGDDAVLVSVLDDDGALLPHTSSTAALLSTNVSNNVRDSAVVVGSGRGSGSGNGSSGGGSGGASTVGSGSSNPYASYHLILLDIVMPRSNGVYVAQHLRQHGYTGR